MPGDQSFNDLLDTSVAQVPKFKVAGIKVGRVAFLRCRQCFA